MGTWQLAVAKCHAADTEMNPETQATIASVYEEGLASGIHALAGWKRQVYLLVEVETYLSMEGFEGILRSPLAECTSEVVDALRAIGATESAQLMLSAIALLSTAGRSLADGLDSLSDAQLNEFDSIGDAFTGNPDRRSQMLEDYVTRIQHQKLP